MSNCFQVSVNIAGICKRKSFVLIYSIFVTTLYKHAQNKRDLASSKRNFKIRCLTLTQGLISALTIVPSNVVPCEVIDYLQKQFITTVFAYKNQKYLTRKEEFTSCLLECSQLVISNGSFTNVCCIYCIGYINFADRKFLLCYYFYKRQIISKCYCSQELSQLIKETLLCSFSVLFIPTTTPASLHF
jgi:hypothetical protein